MSGAFITFEGGDGSGKSTQSELLAQWLRSTGREVVHTREPGGTELGLEIRRLVQHRRGHIVPRAEALLYAADRAHHVATVVRPALARGAIVVQDRYLDSSIAYQGIGRDLDPGRIRDISLWAAEGLLSGLTVLLDLELAISRERLGERTVYDRLEAVGGDFPLRVREAYLRLAEAEPKRFLVLDGALAPEVLAERIRERVAALL